MLALCKTHTEIKKLLKSPLKWAYYVLKREAVIMGTVSTSDETKQEYIKQMGEELGLLFYALWKEITWLHLKWHEYVTLFGTKSSRIELLNDVAPLFFRIVQDSLWDDILLHIARTTDPPKSSGKKNLTIRRLASLVTDEEVASIVKKQSDIVIENTKFCRNLRNRRLAHRDLQLAISERAEPLESASRSKIKVAIKSIDEVMNIISEHYSNSTILFDLIREPSGAESLLYILDDGLRTLKERSERIKAGKFLPHDLKTRNL